VASADTQSARGSDPQGAHPGPRGAAGDEGAALDGCAGSTVAGRRPTTHGGVVRGSAGSMTGTATRVRESATTQRRAACRKGYVRIQAFVPAVLWDAARQDARRTHRSPSAYVIVALEKALGWDEPEES
jgi:hypothetical protein